MAFQFFTRFDDNALIKLLKDVNPQKQNEAFRYLYRKVFPLVERFVLQNGGNRDDALDIFQDAIVIFNTHIQENRFKGTSSISTYLFSIAKNLWFQLFRKNKRHEFTAIFKNEETVELNSDDLESISSTKRIEALLQKLDKDCRDILLQYYFKDSTMKEIKEYFNLGSEQAAKNKKHRCMKKLEELFKRYNIEKDTFDFGNE